MADGYLENHYDAYEKKRQEYLKRKNGNRRPDPNRYEGL